MFVRIARIGIRPRGSFEDDTTYEVAYTSSAVKVISISRNA